MLGNELLENTIAEPILTRQVNNVVTDNESSHTFMKLDGQRQKCYFCSNGYEIRQINKTWWYSGLCGISKPLCSPNTGRDCWMKHITSGMPNKSIERLQRPKKYNIASEHF